MKETSDNRTFESGATRDTSQGKLDFEAILSPMVLLRYVQYMDKHKEQANGEMRPGDNWQQGIPKDAYIKSGYRHFMDWWMLHRGVEGGISEDIEEILCALIFNAQGYLFEILMEKSNTKRPGETMSPEMRRQFNEQMERMRRESQH